MKINYKSMSKLSFFTLITLVTLFISRSVYGQSKPPGESFPAYRQIKPIDGEIIDYGSSGKTALLRSNVALSLFDYPKGTVTYVLNGKPTTDVDYVRQVTSKKSTQIEAVFVGKPDEDGKRTIVITYESR